MVRSYFTILLLLCLSLSPTSSTSPSPPPPSKSPPPSPSPAPADIVYNHVCDQKRYAELGLDMSLFAFCNKSLSFYVRAKDLVDSMTLQEKVLQLGNSVHGVWTNLVPGVPRLGIPKYNWWGEALHGISSTGKSANFDNKLVPGATSFPTPLLTTSAFNESLWKTIGQVVSTEGRAMHNVGVAGLTFWSPTINVVRDPRWGRTLETPGEDPFVIGRYAVNYVRGLQDVEGYETTSDLNTRPLKLAACCKHYAAYDLEHWGGFDRRNFNANVTEQDMVETFLRPFEMCVKEGDVSSVMCSFNNVNGIPVCADAKLLSQTIRGDWNLHGYIVADCDSIEVISQDQKFLQDTEVEGAAQAIYAGLDLDCGEYYPKFLEAAVMKGLTKESDVDKALINNYLVLFRVGWFDANPMYESLGAADVCTKENIELAADAARQGIVLLKNSALPLDPKKYKNIAVVGPHANATDVMIGNYHGVPCRYVSPLDGFSKYTTIDYQMGCGDVQCRNESYIFPAMRAAKEADATIILAGIDLDAEREDMDRTKFDLPGYQNQLINQVAMVAKGPVILVILSGGAVDISFAQDSEDIDSIIWASYPGEEGGRAIADIVFGKYNPGGRLPITWYNSDYVNNLPMTSMQMRPIDELGYPGRTYKFYNGSVTYPFGYGLSYTNFTYNLVSSQKHVEKKLGFNQHCLQMQYNADSFVPPCPGALVQDMDCEVDDLTLEIEVTNTGELDGSDVVMVYSRAPDGIVGAPIKQVVAFQRVFVPAGESEIVKFMLNSCKSLSLVTGSAYIALPSGEHTIIVGTGSNEISFPFQVYLKS